MVEKHYDSPIGAGDIESQKEHAKDETAAEARKIEAGAREKGNQFKNEAIQRTRTVVDSQKEQTAKKLASAAVALRQTSENLREQQQDTVARYADLVGERFESLSGYLDQKAVEDIFQDAEEMIRSRPGVFLGGAFALGIVAARFMKASGRSV